MFLENRLLQAHELLREGQQEVITTDTQEPPLLKRERPGVMLSKCRKKRENSKKQKFVGPYHVIEILPNHTYTTKRQCNLSISRRHIDSVESNKGRPR